MVKNKRQEDIELTSWGTNIFAKSVNRHPDLFVLGAHYADNNPDDDTILKIVKLYGKYKEIATDNKNFKNEGYIKFIKNHFNDNLEKPIKPYPQELYHQ